jgi:RNA polymerase sigma-70 factor (ECF subfamily)
MHEYTTRELKLEKLDRISLAETIELVRQGDTEAFEPIYTNYFGLVHSICLRMLRDPVEAEDVAQDTFVHLLRKIHMFRGESAFSSWLYRLTTNLVLMRFRRKKPKLSSLDELLDDEDEGKACSEIGGPDLHLAGLLDRINLQAAIDLLPQGYKAAFILHDVHGYEHREIALICGYSAGNSKSQLHKARQRLRTLLRKTMYSTLPESRGITNHSVAIASSD